MESPHDELGANADGDKAPSSSDPRKKRRLSLRRKRQRALEALVDDLRVACGLEQRASVAATRTRSIRHSLSYPNASMSAEDISATRAGALEAAIAKLKEYKQQVEILEAQLEERRQQIASNRAASSSSSSSNTISARGSTRSSHSSSSNSSDKIRLSASSASSSSSSSQQSLSLQAVMPRDYIDTITQDLYTALSTHRSGRVSSPTFRTALHRVESLLEQMTDHVLQRWRRASSTIASLNNVYKYLFLGTELPRAILTLDGSQFLDLNDAFASDPFIGLARDAILGRKWQPFVSLLDQRSFPFFLSYLAKVLAGECVEFKGVIASNDTHSLTVQYDCIVWMSFDTNPLTKSKFPTCTHCIALRREVDSPGHTPSRALSLAELPIVSLPPIEDTASSLLPAILSAQRTTPGRANDTNASSLSRGDSFLSQLQRSMQPHHQHYDLVPLSTPSASNLFAAPTSNGNPFSTVDPIIQQQQQQRSSSSRLVSTPQQPHQPSESHAFPFSTWASGNNQYSDHHGMSSVGSLPQSHQTQHQLLSSPLGSFFSHIPTQPEIPVVSLSSPILTYRDRGSRLWPPSQDPANSEEDTLFRLD